jgi:hypothetical protein
VDVAPHLHFTLVAGVTRHAIACTDSGPNHLNDISLEPQYAGICGFTQGELDYLFADRMESTLLALKEANRVPPAATVGDLKCQIVDWYGGYDWDCKTKILNPYSALNFFDKLVFSDY